MDLKAYLESEHIPFEENTDLSKRTWIHRGGTARYYIIPETTAQLSGLVKRLYAEQKPFKIVGHTSNIYIRNTTDIEIVISTIHLTRYEEKDGQYICDCGVAIAGLSKQAISAGHAGYEGFINLPGTVASAAVNNAGCFRCSISNLLIDAEVLCPDGQIRIYTKDMFGYSERSSAFKRGDTKGVLLRVTLDCHRQDSVESLQKKAEANSQYRKTCQEGPKQNLGSTYPLYVMDAFYRNLPFHTRLCLLLSVKLHNITGTKRSQQLVNTIILLCSGKYARLHRYISKHNFGCFVWRDEKADKAFEDYRSFIAKTSGMSDTEIEII